MYGFENNFHRPVIENGGMVEDQAFGMSVCESWFASRKFQNFADSAQAKILSHTHNQSNALREKTYQTLGKNERKGKNIEGFGEKARGDETEEAEQIKVCLLVN
eukprot:5337287-Amphidinium_carterae.1